MAAERANAPASTALTAEEISRQSLELSQKLNQIPQAQNYQDVNSNWNAMKKLASQNTQAAAVGMITALAKILDPGAVVREADFTILAEAGSPARRLQGYLDKLKGKGQLTANMKKELLDLGKAHVESRYAAYEQAAENMLFTASKQSIPRDSFQLIGKPDVGYPDLGLAIPPDGVEIPPGYEYLGINPQTGKMRLRRSG